MHLLDEGQSFVQNSNILCKVASDHGFDVVEVYNPNEASTDLRPFGTEPCAEIFDNLNSSLVIHTSHVSLVTWAWILEV